jgi:chloramphenicol 3-O-phosphotransferase
MNTRVSSALWRVRVVGASTVGFGHPRDMDEAVGRRKASMIPDCHNKLESTPTEMVGPTRSAETTHALIRRIKRATRRSQITRQWKTMQLLTGKYGRTLEVWETDLSQRFRLEGLQPVQRGHRSSYESEHAC